MLSALGAYLHSSPCRVFTCLVSLHSSGESEAWSDLLASGGAWTHVELQDPSWLWAICPDHLHPPAASTQGHFIY